MRGRPPRKSDSSSESERDHFREDLLIAEAVYLAVLDGQPYRDAALQEGVAKARLLGRKVTADGVEAMIERLIKDPEALINNTPRQVLESGMRLWLSVKDEHEVRFLPDPQDMEARPRAIVVKKTEFIPLSAGDEPSKAHSPMPKVVMKKQ